ncbi:redoxin domain-containing protein [Haematomicrobium sanguinis]|uniref:redoxin domain-containing protein n=1 Tax=Haematomicrobium sanguinis TaxID=479106 RepID=UPI000479DB09|nr:redoxin domain-containing protein [Haematomicrobium sanguinis]
MARRQPLAVGHQLGELALVNHYGENVVFTRTGQPTILVFYPFAFSRVCTGELASINARHGDFERAGIRLMGVSVDHKFALRSFADAEGITFDLLADFWPHGAVAEHFGVFDSDSGMAGRYTFAISSGGVIADVFSTDLGVPRPMEKYQRLVDTVATWG